MNYEEFCCSLQETLLNDLDPASSIHREHVLKNNGYLLDSIAIVNPNNRCSPLISLPMLYERYREGIGLSRLCKEITAAAGQTAPKTLEKLSSLQDPSVMEDRITMQLVSRANNKEYLKNLPWLPYLDLAVIFSLELSTEKETQIHSVITKSISSCWGLDAHELFQIARKNAPNLLPASFCSLNSLLTRHFPPDAQTDANPEASCLPTELSCQLYLLTNSAGNHGASCILYPGKLQEISEQLDSDLLILPSSVHEVLILADLADYTEHDYRSFCDIIKSVNRDVVSQVDFLSDTLYRYDRKTDKVSIYPLPALLPS